MTNHGVFAPNSNYRSAVIIKKTVNQTAVNEVRTESKKRRAMSWAVRLKRAFKIDIQVCKACGELSKVIACIEYPVVIKKILVHLKTQQASQFIQPVNRAPPVSFIAR